MAILVTGGAGYIGSHAVQRLLRDGRDVLVVDNLMRGHQEAVRRLEPKAGASAKLAFARLDINSRPALEKLLRDHHVDSVLHFAALAAVGESVQDPLLYYANNTAGMISLLQACDAVGVTRLVFSSSCATYGQPPADQIPVSEDCPQNPMSPYGATKLHGEHLLRDYMMGCRHNKKPFAYAALRYFNVAGSDRTGVIGEVHDPETHIIPAVLQHALGKRPHVGIFGTDYPTPDGTCVRDYVHVEDLIDAHIRVLDALKPGDERHYNLGIGTGYSVRQIIDGVRRVTGKELKVVEQPRRPGDPPQLFNNPAKIQRELQWTAKITSLDETIESAWRFMKNHPNGYAR